MQEVTPKVVAMAVSTVMRMFRILFQICLFSIVLFSFWLVNVLWHTDVADVADDHRLLFHYFFSPLSCRAKHSAALQMNQ